jgi:hydroxymethylpyrimidine/phosphomethylpyrimidine kinase
MPAYPLPPVVLTFAAADPSGGAGLQADLLTLSSMGCHALSVVTALTVQDTAGVDAIAPVDAEWVADQARLLLEDMTVQSFKVGYAATVENIAAIAEIVSDYPDVPLILDPVLLSARAEESAVDDLVAALRDLLVPQATVVTCSAADLRRLMQEDPDEPEEGSIDDCAARLAQLGAEFVLVTGTHQNTPEIVNTLYGAQGIVRQDKWERLPGRFHGAGCTLSAAIAATLANGLELAEAIRDAQEYTWQTLAAGFRPGMGRVLPDRFFWAREGDDEPAAAPDA